MTVFIATNGLANNTIHAATPILPIKEAALALGRRSTMANIDKTVMIAASMCMSLDPGSVGDFFGAYLRNLTK
jgi:hypothetical protein